MSGFQIRSMGQLSHFQAFRTVRLKDDRGFSFQLIVPARLSGEQITESGYQLEHFLIMHAGSVAEVVYQAYLGCIDWFRFHRPAQQDATTADYFRRMKNALRQATTYHQRFADKEFIETYNGCVVGDQSAAIEKLRSACYDVFKQECEPATALDMAFVAQIYATAVYQTTVTEKIIKTEFSLSGINWAKPYRRFALHDVISFAKRLLREKYGIDMEQYDEKIGDMAEYVFLDMTRSIFDHERIERNIRAAYAELPPEKRELYGSVEDQLQHFGIGPKATTINPEAHG